MPAEVKCSRCRRTAQAPAPVFLPAELRETVLDNVCAACWKDWQEEQTRLINELRLDLSEPESHETLHGRLRTFLGLPGGPAGGD